MNIEEFREICTSFEAVTEGYPFDNDVLAFKVMDKIFALTNVEKFESINLKCDPVKAATLRDLYPEVKPGYHMNKKHWNTIDPHGYLSDVLIKEWIKDSYDLVVEGLPRKEQRKVEKLIEKKKKKQEKEKKAEEE